MRIALVSIDALPLQPAPSAVPPNGLYVTQLARAYARAGHRADVFVRRVDLWGSNTESLAPNAGLVRVPAGPPLRLEGRALRSLAHDFGTRLVDCAAVHGPYDIVHASYFLSGAGATRLRKRFGIPFVLSCQSLGKSVTPSPDQQEGLPERVALEKALVRTADRLIATCPIEREVLATRYGADPARVEVIPFGVNATEFRPAGTSARSRLGVPHDEFLILAFGANAPSDGVDDAIRGLGHLRRDYRVRAWLVIARRGTEPLDLRGRAEPGRLQALAAREGVSGQLLFTDPATSEAPADLYRAADAMVATPREDTNGLRALEAMACGVPVVAARTGALPYLVDDAVTGFVVAPRDPAAIAGRLARLVANRELGRAYGRAGVLKVRAGLTWDHVAARLVGIYAATLAPQGSRLARIVSGR